MAKILGRLKNDEGKLLIAGQVSERLPAVTSGLMAHYPFDGNERGTNFKNLIDYSTWVLGSSGSQPGFSQNGSIENFIVEDKDPFNVPATIWEARATGGHNADDGGWNGANVPIDNTKTYRFSVWIRRKVVGNGSTYHGCLANSVNNLSDSLQNGNPYFWAGGISSTEWRLYVGHVFPYTYALTTGHADSGVYNMSGKIATGVTDYKWNAGAGSSNLRTYLYYSTDTSTVQQFCYPRVEALDGTECSIADLFNGCPNSISPNQYLVDEVNIDFGGAIGAPYGRDQYTRMGHIMVTGENGIDYGLNSNGATWTASSTYAPNVASNIGLPMPVINNTLDVDNGSYHHMDNTGSKWYNCKLSVARKIVKLQLNTAYGNGLFNRDDFPHNIVITTKYKGATVNIINYSMLAPTGNPRCGEPMTIIDISNKNNTLTSDGMYIQAATTNLCTSTDFSSGWWQSGALSTFAPVNMPFKGTMVKAMKALYSGSGDGHFGWNFTFTGAANKAFSIGFWAKSDTPGVIYGSCGLQDTTQYAWPTGYIQMNLTPEWQYFTLSGTAAAGCGDGLRIIFRPMNSTTNNAYYTMPQVEQRAYSTAFVNGVRSYEGKCYVPIRFYQNTNFAISIDVSGGRTDDSTCDVICDDTDRWNGQVRVNTATSIELLARDSNRGGTHNLYGTIANHFDGKKHNYIIQSISGYGTKIYQDGVLALDAAGVYVEYTSVSVGRNGMGDGATRGGLYRNLSFYNKVLSATEINKLVKNKFSITNSGNVITSQIIEKPISMPSDVYYYPLGNGGKDSYTVFSPSRDVDTVYNNGAVWIGSSFTNLFKQAGTTSDFTGVGSGVFTIKNMRDTVEFQYDYAQNLTWTYHGQSMALTTGASYIASMDVLITSDANIPSTGATWVADMEGGLSGAFNYDNTKKGKWQHFDVTCTATATSGTLYLYPTTSAIPATIGSVKYRNVMVTAKPFISPFTKVVRNASALEFNFNSSIGLSWATDWTIMYWKKPMGTYTDNLTGYCIESLGSNSNSVGGGYIWWGKDNGNDAIASSSPGTITPASYFNNWRMITLTKTGTTITIREWQKDGVIHSRTIATTNTVANYFVNQYGYDFKLGGWDGGSPVNAWYKDLIVAKRCLSDTEILNIRKEVIKDSNSKILISGALTETSILL